MEQVEYAVMLFDPKNEKTAELIKQLAKGKNGNGLDLAMGAYSTEVAAITGWPEGMFKPSKEAPVCVAFTKDMAVLGFITIAVDTVNKITFTEHVYVRPEVRKKGVYKLMMKRIEKFAKDTKCERIVSFVFDKNDVSKKAHKKTGFKPVMRGYSKEVK